VRKTDGIEDGDVNLYYYDGTNWDFVVDLNSLGPHNSWLHYTEDITDSQYFISNFEIRVGSNISAGEVFIDDVSVTNTWPLGSKWLKGPLDVNSYDPPGLMELGATYYWRVDEVNDACSASPWKGYTWTFTTEDGKARDPSPYDRQGSVPLTGATISWTPSCLADWHNLFFGADFDDVNTGAQDVNIGWFQETQGDLTGWVQYGTRYYWRVDESGDAGVIKGDVWMFQTVGYPLIHYKFDGVIDDNVPLPITDDTGNVTFVHGPGYGSGGEGQLKYDQPNPLYNIEGTSAHFMPATPEEGGGAIYLYRKAIDSDILDLDGDEYTIEMWVKKDSDWPQNFSEDKGGDEDYAATLFRKFDRSYVVAIGEDGAARFAHAGLGFSGCRLESPPDRIDLGQWHHIAAVFDFGDPCTPEKLYIDGLVVADGNSYDKNPTNDDDPTTIGGTVSPLRLGEGAYMSN
jgi:hypothetical protein